LLCAGFSTPLWSPRSPRTTDQRLDRNRYLHEAFRPDPALSGRGVYTHSAIVATDNGTALRLATSLVTHSDRSGPPPPASTEETDATASRRSLSLLAVVHFLWEQAGLSVWSRREGKRTWRTSHARLLSVIRDCTANGTSLEDLLYVVPAFDRAVAQCNAQGWEDFAASLGGVGGVSLPRSCAR
jgi:hypothetical protein